jgi:hypothetical protein
MIHDLRQRLVPNCIPIFTSDGLNHYFYALTAHFGHWVTGDSRRVRRWQVNVASLGRSELSTMFRRSTQPGTAATAKELSSECYLVAATLEEGFIALQ